MNAIHRLENYAVAALKACGYISGVFLILLVILTMVHVIGRYGFAEPILGFIEISQYLEILLIFPLFAYAMVEKSHVTMGILVDRLPERTQAIIDSVIYSAFLVFTILASRQTFVRSLAIMDSGQVGNVTNIPYYPFYIIAAIFWAVLGVAILIHLAHVIAKAAQK